MNGLPQITIVGTLTGDPELKMLPSGVALTKVRIAANDRKFNKATGQYENGDSTYLTGTIWRDYAEHVAESLRKGDKVIAIGRLKQREYEKDGATRTIFELELDEIGPTLRFSTAKTAKAGTPVAAGWGNPTAADQPDW